MTIEALTAISNDFGFSSSAITAADIAPSSTLSMPMNTVGASQTDASSNEFNNMLLSGVQQLNTKVQASEDALQNYILNNNISTHELMIAMEQAKHAMEIAVEVRNKAVEAYQQIVRMQI